MRAVFLVLTLSAPALAVPCVPLAGWPTQEWSVQLVDPAAKATQIKALEDLAFTRTGKDEERLGVRTDGLVIIRNGVLVYEKYARGFDASKRHISWSVAKSISSALTGVAVSQGVV
ncbi:MAG: serine hydrolase domain-containing protein, partial [Myxococcaceae bacterium]